VEFPNETTQYMKDVLFDAQTSGGLLICLEPVKAELLLDRLQRAGSVDAAIVGEVSGEARGRVTVK